MFLGPSTLGIYKSFAISGGLQFHVYRATSSVFPREKVRVAVNVSYFLSRFKETIIQSSSLLCLSFYY